jgi:hypothetical protein
MTMYRSFTRRTPVLAFLAIAGLSTPVQAAFAAPVAGTTVQDERRQGQEERRDRGQDDRRDARQDDRRDRGQDDRRDARDDRDAPQAYRVKNILGTKVSIQGDVSIGTVDDIVFTDDGYVEYLIVNNDGKLRTIPWAAAKFNFEQRTATVNITQSQFQSVPTYTPDRYPVFFSPNYRGEVYRYYGLTPRVLRRMDRR